MPRAKPEVEWSARTELPDIPYDDLDEDLIVNAVEGNESRQLSEADRRQLLDLVRYIGRLFLLAKHQQLGPTHKQIQAALSKVHKGADRLFQTVSSLDEATINALYRQDGEFRKAYRDAEGDSAQERCAIALSIISALAAEAKAAGEEVGKPHPPVVENPLHRVIDWEIDLLYGSRIGSRSPLGMFIFRLADIFYEITGEEPQCKHDRDSNKYYGDFLLFVRACLEPLESESRKALGRTTADHLLKWRETRAPKS
jgi:hypothetical protein